MPETLVQEFARLVREYRAEDEDSQSSTKDEAWNLIADFAEANAAAIIEAFHAAAKLREGAEPVAWLDDGTVRAGSERTAHRVVTDAQKRDMPSAVRNSFNVALYLHPTTDAAHQNRPPVSGREVIAKSRIDVWGETGESAADVILRDLTAAGYRIIGPGEDSDEASAEEFERTAAFWGAEADKALKAGNHDEARRCLVRSKRHALCAVRRRAALDAEGER